MRKFNKFWIVLLIVIGFNQVTLGQSNEHAVPLGTSQNMLKKLQSTTAGNSNARVVTEVDLAISGTESLKGIVNFKKSDSNSEFLEGEISGVKDASFYINASSSNLEGHIIIKSNKTAYKYFSDASGNAFVQAVDINSLICIGYENKPTPQTTSSLKQEAVTIAPALLDLQSLPGAAGCVMLDFDGYYMAPGNYWNNGNEINAAASGMSDANIQEFWEVVSEDYRPFNVNITTNESVFNSYPRNRRMRVVVTPTNTAAPGAGGVAYVGSFNWDNDVPCWVYVLGGKSGGDAASHEVGHTFDLSHDGRELPTTGHEEYFVGLDNTSWAPIMGAGYYRPVVQWSKGEYQYANQFQDDVAIIAGSKFGVGYRGDDYGDNTSSAANIDYNGAGDINQKYGIISSEADYDFFTFTTGGGNVTINANTVGRDGNLHVLLRLYDAASNLIGTYWNSDPYSLNASMNVNLAAGKYYLGVDGNGAGNPSSGGYSAYGSIGSYWLTGHIPPAATVNSSTGLVTTYKDINYTGFSGGFSVGDYNLAALKALGVEDNSITSVKVMEGYKIILYFDDNFTGQSLEITSNNNYVGSTFNDQVTSLRVLTNGVTNITGTYYLQNRNSGLNMDVTGGTGAIGDGANIQQWNVAKTTNQQFKFEHLGNGTYKVSAVHSGKVLDVSAISKANGANVQQWTYYGTPNQQFIVVATDLPGCYKLIAKHSGKVVEVAGASTALEANVQQWDNNNQTCGQWKLVDLYTPTTGLVTTYKDVNYTGFSGGFTVGDYNLAALTKLGVEDNSITSVKVTEGYKIILYFDDNFTGQSVEITSDNGYVGNFNDQVTSLRVRTNGVTNVAGTYFLQNRNSGLNMDVWGLSTADGANIAQGTPNGGKNQQFQLEHLGDGTYKVTAVHSGKVLDIDAIKTNDGANAQQWTYFGSWNQQYIAFPTDLNGCFKLIAKHSGKVVEVTNASMANGANVQQWTNNNQTCGQWKFVPVSNTPPPVNQAPSVSLTSPANNAAYNAPATINIGANASDADGNVTKVEFYNGANKLGEDASAPYTFSWTNVAAGTYTISVKAFDNSNASTTSGSVTVKVNPVVVTDLCSTLPTYGENNGYAAGDKVKNVGKQFECKEWPYSGWCDGAAWAYAPGTGTYWTDAWYDRGTCNARSAADLNNATATISADINLAPNPANSDITIISGSNLNESNIQIIDAMGRVVLNETYQGNSINLSTLSTGIYNMIISTSNGERVTKTFVKQ